MRFLYHLQSSLERNFAKKYGKKIIDTTAETRMDPTKTAYKGAVQKIAEAADGLHGIK